VPGGEPQARDAHRQVCWDDRHRGRIGRAVVRDDALQFLGGLAR
jgi:hypothetical protein